MKLAACLLVALAAPAQFAPDCFSRPADAQRGRIRAAQQRALKLLRLGTVRIHTPAGTDFMFRMGARSAPAGGGEVDLPAGVLRLAPVNESASGNIVIPEARFGGTVAKKVVLQIDNGRQTRAKAEAGLEAVEAARRFWEFAVGFNPQPGCGAGGVWLSLGGDEGAGGNPRRFFFPDATVHVDYRYLVRDGKLVFQESR
ncbi:MAG: hypothetical protein AAB225_12205 [Acidobacteriota bacterium]